MGLRVRIAAACLLLAGLSTAIVVAGVIHPKLARYGAIDAELARTGLQAADMAADYVGTRVDEASRRVSWLAQHEHLQYRNHAEAAKLLRRLRDQAAGRPPLAALDAAGRVVAASEPLPPGAFAAVPEVRAARARAGVALAGRLDLPGRAPLGLVAARFKYYDRQGEHWGVVVEGLDLAAWDRALNARSRQVEVFDGAGRALVPPGGRPGPERPAVREALAGRRGTKVADGRDVRAWAPIAKPGWAAVVTVAGTAAYLPLEEDIRRAAAWGGVALLVALLLALALSSWLLAPLRRLEAGADALARGDWEAGRAALPTGRRDEIGRLAARIQAMAAELRGRFEGIEAEVQARTADLAARSEELATRSEELADANARLAAAVADLQALDELKRAFLDAVSHELRTPLNFIMAFGSTMEDGVFGDLSADQAHALRRMMEGADQLLVIVDDLLEIARLEAGRRALAPMAVDVAELMRIAAGQFERADPSHGRSFVVELPPDVPPVWADPEAVGVVLRQLLSNAVKFSEPGARVALAAEAAGEGVAIVVADTGIGIRPEDLPHIWDAFRQGDHRMTRRYGGTGVGLAIVRRLVEAMGGEVTVASTPGAGSRFRFTLPRARTEGPAGPVA